jgi:hypothetical protein
MVIINLAMMYLFLHLVKVLHWEGAIAVPTSDKSVKKLPRS